MRTWEEIVNDYDGCNPKNNGCRVCRYCYVCKKDVNTVRNQFLSFAMNCTGVQGETDGENEFIKKVISSDYHDIISIFKRENELYEAYYDEEFEYITCSHTVDKLEYALELCLGQFISDLK